MSGVSIASGVIATDALGGGVGRGLQSPGILAQSAVAASVTGTLTETVLATIPIPAGAMGVNGMLRVTALWSYTNSANTKTARYRLSGQSLGFVAVTTSSSSKTQAEIANRGALNSQVSGVGALVLPFTNSASAVQTFAIDMSVSQNITLTGLLTNVGETITLESYTVELLNP